MAAPLPLVVVGAALSAIPSTPLIEVNPHVILGVVLPPLLYAAALQMPFVDFRRNLRVYTWGSIILGALITSCCAYLPKGSNVARRWLAGGVAGGPFDLVHVHEPTVPSVSMVVARAAQGLFAAIACPTALALIATTFAPGKARNQAFAIFGAMAGLGSVSGLVAGGLLATWDWRFVFWINVPVGIVCIIGAVIALAVYLRWLGVALRPASDELAEDDPAEDLTGRLTPFVAVAGAALLIAASIAPRLLL